MPTSSQIMALLVAISTIVGVCYTVVKLKLLSQNDDVIALSLRSAVQEEKINGIQSDVKDIKEDVKDLRKDLDEIKNLIIKGIRENNERDDK